MEFNDLMSNMDLVKLGLKNNKERRYIVTSLWSCDEDDQVSVNMLNVLLEKYEKQTTGLALEDKLGCLLVLLMRKDLGVE